MRGYIQCNNGLTGDYVKKIARMLLVIVFGTTVFAKENPGELYAQSAVLMDADTGRILFQKNGEEERPMASTTKIMTCILALENMEEEAIVTVSKNAASQPKVHLGAKAGEQFYLKDLLHSLMLESHNDSAVAIAEAVAGDEQMFSEWMDKKAKEIGCDSTNFVTSNGLDAEDAQGQHRTTAIDLARVMRYCITDSPKRQRFLEITRTANYSFRNQERTKQYYCQNHNAFLGMMKEALTGKTGYTSKAGYCYVGAVRSDKRTYIVVLLGCGWPNHKNYKWQDMRKLAMYGLEYYTYQDESIVTQKKKIQITNGVPDSGTVFSKKFAEIGVLRDEWSGLLHEEEKIVLQEYVEKQVNAPVKKGDRVGKVIGYLNGEIVFREPIVVLEDVSEKTFRWYLFGVLKMYAPG